jgi:hypothetical protein
VASKLEHSSAQSSSSATALPPIAQSHQRQLSLRLVA